MSQDIAERHGAAFHRSAVGEANVVEVMQAHDALRQHFADAEFDTLDGLRLDWPGRWLLVRASNTEPIVRAIAEAPTAEEPRRLCNEAGEVLLGGDQE